MTITDVTPHALDVRDMTDAELLDLYREADDLTQAAAMREAARRDRDATLAASRRKLAEIHAEGYDAAYAQYLKASDYTRGVLLSDLGKRRVTDEMSLWTGSKAEAERNASEELRDFWMFVEPRITPGSYARQRGSQARIERETARDEREARNGRNDRQGLADDAPGALRQEPDVTQRAARSGGPGTLRPGRRGSSDATQDQAEGAATGRPGRSVQRDGRVAGMTETGTVAVPVSGTVVRSNEPRIPGDQLLDLLASGWFSHYARFGSPAAADAVTLWAAHCWMRDEGGILVTRATPRLYLLSSAPGSGKSHVLELLSMVVPNCHGLDLEPTAPGLAYTLSSEHATVLIDESDVLFGQGTRRQAVRAIINGGYTRRGTYLNGKGGKATRLPIFGPVAMAGLDTMETDTGESLKALLSRGVKIRMEKAPSDNPPAKLTAAAEDAAGKVQYWLERWAGQVRGEVAEATPEIPEGLDGRAEEIWIPLLAIAEAAGGTWPDRARAACRELTLAEPQGEDVEAQFAAFASEFAGL
jgi:hypothetical protein